MTGELVLPCDIAARLGVKSNTVSSWAARYPDFPPPVDRSLAGPIRLWSQVRAWYDAYHRPANAPVATVPRADVVKARDAALAAISRHPETDRAADILANPLRRPKARRMVRDQRGRAANQDGRGAGTGSGTYDLWYAIDPAERKRISADLQWVSPGPGALAPDQLIEAIRSSGAATGTDDQVWAQWVWATRYLGAFRALAHPARAIVPRRDSYGGTSLGDLFPDIAGDLERLFGDAAGEYLAELETPELERDRTCSYGPSPVEMSYSDYAAELDATEALAGGADDGWPTAEQVAARGRLTELIPSDLDIPDDMPLPAVYVAVVGAYAADLI